MEFGILGPVEVWADGRAADAGHARQRAVLAVLLLDLGRAVPLFGLRGGKRAYDARLRSESIMDAAIAAAAADRAATARPTPADESDEAAPPAPAPDRQAGPPAPWAEPAHPRKGRAN
jgi:hypothetical protein